MASRPNYKMSIQDRAKQFMPFAALKGYEEALLAKEKIVVDKITLSPEMADELDRRMAQVQKGDVITVVYYENGQYIQKTGMIAKIDTDSHFIQIVDTKISFADIYDIKLPD